MKPTRVKPISYVKANAATQETLAFLEIVALGKRQIDEGKAIPLVEAARRLRARRARRT